jgi:hypothetical protein
VRVGTALLRGLTSRAVARLLLGGRHHPCRRCCHGNVNVARLRADARGGDGVIRQELASRDLVPRPRCPRL